MDTIKIKKVLLGGPLLFGIVAVVVITFLVLVLSSGVMKQEVVEEEVRFNPLVVEPEEYESMGVDERAAYLQEVRGSGKAPIIGGQLRERTEEEKLAALRALRADTDSATVEAGEMSVEDRFERLQEIRNSSEGL